MIDVSLPIKHVTAPSISTYSIWKQGVIFSVRSAGGIDVYEERQLALSNQGCDTIVGVYCVNDDGTLYGRKRGAQAVVISSDLSNVNVLFKLPELFTRVTMVNDCILGYARWELFDDAAEIVLINLVSGDVRWRYSHESRGLFLVEYLLSPQKDIVFFVYKNGTVEASNFRDILLGKEQAFPEQPQHVFLFQDKIIGVIHGQLIALSTETLEPVWQLPILPSRWAVVDPEGKLYSIGGGHLTCIDLTSQKEVFKHAIGVDKLNDIDAAFIKSDDTIGQAELTTTHLLVAYTKGVFAAINKVTAEVEFFQRLEGTFPHKTPIKVSGNRVYLQTHEALEPGKYYYYTFEGAGGYRPDA